MSVTTGRAGQSRAQLLGIKRRRSSTKFIPDADGEFAFMAKIFIDNIERDPAKCHLPPELFAQVVEAVDTYRTAVAANTHRYTKCLKTVYEKNAARERCEKLVREAGNLIRANRQVDPITKKVLRIGIKAERLKRFGVPQTAPELTFAGHVPFTNTIDGKHILNFSDPFGKLGSKLKPEGVERLELYVDLVPVNEPIPTWPGQRWGGRTWYLRSFKRSPMKVTYPKCNEPMRVVYWACWANSAGEKGPWSLPIATRVEGIDPVLPAPPTNLGGMTSRREQTVIITSGHKQLPDLVEMNTIDESRMLTDDREEAA